MSGLSRKLTRDELLAGKIHSDESSQQVSIAEVDPRIKSPDEVLSRMSPKFRTDNPEATPVPAASKLPADPFAEEILRLRSELEQWQHRYSTDIGKWKEYDRRVQEWKNQVQEIFENLRKDAFQKKETEAELIRLRREIADKDQQLMQLRMAAQPNLIPPKPDEPR